MKEDTKNALALILAFWIPLTPCAPLHAASYVNPANEFAICTGLAASLLATSASPDMVFIPGGSFQMGDNKGDGYIDELPVHTVTLDSFYMGKYEITNGQYCQYLNSALSQGLITVTSGVVYKADSGTSYPYCNTSSSSSSSQIAYSNGVFSVRTKGGRNMSNDPMVIVSWYGAAAYCNWRSQQEGKEQCYNLSTWACDFNKHGYRLATEAEWEYAARGGLSSKRFPWGDTISHSQANYYSDTNTNYFYDISPTRGYHPTWNDGIYPYTSPVGSFPANGYGVYDMAGNVWEWCNDWYSDTYYGTSPYYNPTGPVSGSYRVPRGSSWNDGYAYYCRVSSRTYGSPYFLYYGSGFRVSLDISGPAGAPPAKDFFLGGRTQQSGSGSDPVNTATGNFYLNETDLTISGPGMDFEFARAYNSHDSCTGPFGSGWTHSYNTVLANDPCNSLVRVKWDDGRTDYWNPDGLGGYEPNTAGLYDKLTKNPDNTWTVTKKDQTHYEFDTIGKLSRIADKNGNAISLTYDGTSHLDQITDTAGRIIDVVCDANGLIQSLSDPNNRQIIYGYTEGKLASVTDANGNTAYYTYDPGNARLKTITDRRGIPNLTNVYDPNNRVIQQINGRGKISRFSYNVPHENQTTITDPLGRQTVHTHYTGYKLLQSIEDPCGYTVRYTYDENANHTSITDQKGSVRYFSYDDRGNVIKMTAPQTDPNDPNTAAVTIVTYDPNTNNPLTKIEADGAVLERNWRYEYDPNGNLIRTIDPNGYQSLRSYTANGLLSRETDANNHTTKYTYDVQGNLKDVNDALGNITHYTYDQIGRMIKKTDARDNITRYIYDKNDNLLTTTDPNGKTITYTCDKNNNKTSTTDRRGNKGTYEYNENNILIREVDPNGFDTVYGYDDVDNRISVKDKRGKTTKYTYDTLNRLIDVNDPLGHHTSYGYDPKGNKISQTNGLGKTWQYKYDALDRLIEEKDPLGNTTKYEYDLLGRKVALTDAKSNKTRYDYDVLDRLVKVTDATSGITRYEYDPVGNLISIIDANDRESSRGYDDLNRLTSEIDPLDNTTQYRYDKVGNLIEKIDAMDRATIYKYDNLDRLTDVNYPDGKKVTYTYDENGNRIAMTDWNGESHFEYDKLNRITASTDAFGNHIEYKYDPVGNRTAVIYPDGNSVTYTYDNAGRLEKVTDWKGNRTDYFYDAANNLRMVLLPNWTWQLYAYDAASRLTAVTNLDSNIDDIGSFHYTLDSVGNRVEINETGTLPPIIAFSDVNYAYDDADRILAADSTSFDFDDNGNQIMRNDAGLVTSYSYDPEDRLAGVSEPSLNVEHIYDGLGNRITRKVNGVGKRYVLDLAAPMSQVLCETNDNNNVTAYYVYGAGLLAKIAPNGEQRYYHYDGLGSTVALTDENGLLTDQYAYEPFGELANSVGSTDNPFKYVGRFGVITEPDNTLFMRARFYDAVLGRFLTTDPAAQSVLEPLCLNGYIYAKNAPLKYVDPSGLFIFWIGPPTLTNILGELFNNFFSPNIGDPSGITMPRPQDALIVPLNIEPSETPKPSEPPRQPEPSSTPRDTTRVPSESRTTEFPILALSGPPKSASAVRLTLVTVQDTNRVTQNNTPNIAPVKPQTYSQTSTQTTRKYK